MSTDKVGLYPSLLNRLDDAHLHFPCQNVRRLHLLHAREQVLQIGVVLLELADLLESVGPEGSDLLAHPPDVPFRLQNSSGPLHPQTPLQLHVHVLEENLARSCQLHLRQFVQSSSSNYEAEVGFQLQVVP